MTEKKREWTTDELNMEIVRLTGRLSEASRDIRALENDRATHNEQIKGLEARVNDLVATNMKAGVPTQEAFEALQSDVNLLSENFVQLRSEFEDLARMFAKDGERFDKMQQRMNDRDVAGHTFLSRLDTLEKEQQDYIETATAAYGELSERMRAGEALLSDAMDEGDKREGEENSKFDRLFTLMEEPVKQTPRLVEAISQISYRLEALEARWHLPDDVSRVQAREIAQREREEVKRTILELRRQVHQEQEHNETLQDRQAQAQTRIASLEAALKTAIEEKERAEMQVSSVKCAHSDLAETARLWQADAEAYRSLCRVHGKDFCACSHQVGMKMQEDADKWCEHERKEAKRTGLLASITDDEPSGGGFAYTPDMDAFGRDTNDTDYPADAALGALVRRMPDGAELVKSKKDGKFCYNNLIPHQGNPFVRGIDPLKVLQEAEEREEARRIAFARDDNTETPDRDGGVTRPEELGLYRAMEKAQEETP